MKIGDKVRVVASNPRYDEMSIDSMIGSVRTITNEEVIRGNQMYELSDSFYVYEDEIELVKEEEE